MNGHRRLVERFDPEPVSRTEIETHLRIDVGDAADGYMEGLIRTAVQYVSDSTWLGLVGERWEIGLREFPHGPISLYPLPLREVESIEYRTREGDEVTLGAAEYRTVIRTGTATVEPVESWPKDVDPESVRVTYTTGYQPGEAPAQAKHAIRMLTAHWYSMREPAVMGARVNEVPMSVTALIDQIAMRRFR